MNESPDDEGAAFLSALIAVRRSRMTQAEIAEKMGVTQSTVSQFENGMDPRLSTIRRYARVLGVSYHHVITEEVDEEEPERS